MYSANSHLLAAPAPPPRRASPAGLGGREDARRQVRARPLLQFIFRNLKTRRHPAAITSLSRVQAFAKQACRVKGNKPLQGNGGRKKSPKNGASPWPRPAGTPAAHLCPLSPGLSPSAVYFVTLLPPRDTVTCWVFVPASVPCTHTERTLFLMTVIFFQLGTPPFS